MAVGIIQPLLFWTLLVIIEKSFSCFKKLSTSSNISSQKKYLLLFIITGFVLQPYILQTTLEVFRCQNFTPDLESNYFLLKNPNVQCFSRDHLVWIVAPAVLITLIWGLALPYLLFKKLKDPLYKNFFCEDLKNGKKYWELFVIARKVLVIIIVNCAFDASTGIQVLLASAYYICFLFYNGNILLTDTLELILWS